MSDLSSLICDRIRDVPDYPQAGSHVQGHHPAAGRPGVFTAVVDDLAGAYDVDKIVGIEARGFILAAPVAYRAGAGFVPIRRRANCPPNP